MRVKPILTSTCLPRDGRRRVSVCGAVNERLLIEYAARVLGRFQDPLWGGCEGRQVKSLRVRARGN